MKSWRTPSSSRRQRTTALPYGNSNAIRETISLKARQNPSSGSSALTGTSALHPLTAKWCCGNSERRINGYDCKRILKTGVPSRS